MQIFFGQRLGTSRSPIPQSRAEDPSSVYNGVSSASAVYIHPLTVCYPHDPSNKHTGTLASFVSFGINFKASALRVPVSVYVVFIILMASGLFIACFTIVTPSRVRRSDGTPLAHYPHDGFWLELKAQSKLFRDWRLLAMFVPLFGSEIVVIVFSTLNCR